MARVNTKQKYQNRQKSDEETAIFLINSIDEKISLQKFKTIFEPNVRLVNKTDTMGFGASMLLTAVIYDRIDIVEHLLSSGARADISDNTYGTPLWYLISKEINNHYKGENHEKIIKMLLANKADINYVVSYPGENTEQTMLLYATHMQNDKTIIHLLELGADIDFLCDNNSLVKNAMEMAQRFKYKNGIEILQSYKEKKMLLNSVAQTSINIAESTYKI